MLTIEQCRAARGLLGWSAQDLAEKGDIGVATVRRFEIGQPVNPASVERIEATLAGAGIEIIAEGQTSRRGGQGVRLTSAQPKPDAQS